MTTGLNLFVAQLDKNIDDEMFRKKFAKFGELFSAVVAKDEFGDSKGFGFAHFVSIEDGIKALREMNGKTWLSREIHVDVANKQEGRSSTSDVRERIKSLFESQSYTNVVFRDKKNRKASISAHRAILAIGSPLFSKMLFAERDKDTAGDEMKISNMSFDAFTNIVKYLYTDEVVFESDAQVQDLLRGARNFSIPSLVSRCEAYFENMPLSSQNVCSKLQLSTSSKISLLKERCIDFIQNNTLEVINSSDFKNCSPTTISTICNLQSLNIRNEMELLKAVMSWLQVQPILNRKQVIQSLLKSFRFLTFTVEELGEILKSYPDLLTSEEALQIMLYLYDPPKAPDFAKLPVWCNINGKRCFFSDSGLGISLSALNLNDPYVGKVKFPLKPNSDRKFISSLSSLLQVKCISGVHEINAIKLSFQPPVSDRSVIGSIVITIHVHPSGYRSTEKIRIENSENVRVEFKRAIKARTGDLVDIEVEAKDIRYYHFMQFDEAGYRPHNPHFQCGVSCRPKEGKLYFIAEMEYDPQEKDKPAALPRKFTKKP